MPNARFERIALAEHIIWTHHEDELKKILRGFVEEVMEKDVRKFL
jgi:hypothetical protein